MLFLIEALRRTHNKCSTLHYIQAMEVGGGLCPVQGCDECTVIELVWLMIDDEHLGSSYCRPIIKTIYHMVHRDMMRQQSSPLLLVLYYSSHDMHGLPI